MGILKLQSSITEADIVDQYYSDKYPVTRWKILTYKMILSITLSDPLFSSKNDEQ